MTRPAQHLCGTSEHPGCGQTPPVSSPRSPVAQHAVLQLHQACHQS